jgi:hypothetical protein
MLKSRNDCGVCGTPLVYGTETVERRCAYCNQTFRAQIHCPKGHYVCDACHGKSALDVLEEISKNSTSTDPGEILETIMCHPSVSMHGPEHHVVVPVAIITAVKNAGYPMPDSAIEKAIDRGKGVPGGWCGSHGVCGAAIGVGIALSIISGATPLTGKERSLANKATAFALNNIVDGHPRCCKRSSRKAIESAVTFLKEELRINLRTRQPVKCRYSEVNAQCPKSGCVYYQPC